MFWSLLLEPGKRYTKVVDSPFHISAAVLDTATQDPGIVRVIVDIGDTEAHIANLSLRHGIFQFPLDLQFESGSRISFYTTGAKSSVHLSGYVMYEEDELPSDEEDSSEEEVPTLVSAPLKRKPEDNLAASSKKPKLQKVTPLTPNKTAVAAIKASPINPAKANAVSNKEEEEDSDDEDDEDFEVEDGLDDSDEGEEEEEEDYEEEVEEEEEEDEDSDIGEEEVAQLMEVEEKKKGKKAKDLAATPGQFPTRGPVNVFKLEKTPKSAKVPKADNKTPKGAKTPGGEAAKTPKGLKTSGSEGGLQNKAKKTPGKQQGASADVASAQNGKTPKAETPAKDAGKSPHTPKMVKPGGVVCEDMMVGRGPEAKNGKMVSVYYEGRLVSNNKMFDNCSSGKGFKFRLGGGEVIKGWDVGVAGMRIGGKRKITIPPHMAYGKKGAPPDIPGNAALTFVVELKGIS